MEGNLDVLVKWDIDSTVNVVSLKDLSIKDGNDLKKGSRVKMWWSKDRTWWKGTVLRFEGDSEEDSDEDDVPLSHLLRDGGKNQTCDDSDNCSIDEDYEPSSIDSEDSAAGLCELAICKKEIFAACPFCLTMMCHSHFILECRCQKSRKHPENFTVEGISRDDTEPTGPKKSRKAIVKESRNAGISYINENGRSVPQRNVLKSRCNSNFCSKRGLSCDSLSEARRQVILTAYFALPTLHDKRKWLTTHVVSTSPFRTTVKEGNMSRKGRTLHYYLPDENGELLQVCRVLFLATVGVAERQIRTALEKTSTEGILQDENRGGRHINVKERDRAIREDCRSHINRFPRTESHYCRSSTQCEYLSSELTIGKMWEMFKEESGRSDISLSTYYRVFKEMSLKFTKPKKDLCGICEGYRSATAEMKSTLRDRYVQHIREKIAVRELKEAIKSDDDPSHVLASFDLQQVIYLPKSNRCEIFYKRRLSNYNFTIYDIKSKKVRCYLWHEGIAARGANEIASNVFDFLLSIDKINARKVSLFADGCFGQNKNSIMPAMLHNFVQTSKYIEEISLHFFETNHGQNEGDAVHSTIERSLNKVTEITVPSQLCTLIQMSRKDPYTVLCINTTDIVDWKLYSQQMGILRVRESEEGDMISWTGIMQLKVKKHDCLKIFFKMSHLQNTFSTLNLNGRRSSNTELDALNQKAYSNPPKISNEKYTDLKSLCTCDNPVIRSQEARLFYENLPH